MGFIYKITNLKNNKVYIGKTVISIESRWRGHKCAAKNNLDKYVLHKAMRKYGIENFIIELIEECKNEVLDEKEKYYIKKFHSFLGDEFCNGYNMTLGGEGKSLIDHSLIYELWDDGKSISEIAKILNCERNTPFKVLLDYENYSTQESNRRAHVLSGKSKQKPILQLDLNNNLIREFSSAREAAKITGISRPNIVNVANHRKGNHTAGGYRWEYK